MKMQQFNLYKKLMFTENACFLLQTKPLGLYVVKYFILFQFYSYLFYHGVTDRYNALCYILCGFAIASAM